MLASLQAAAPGTIVVLHACCHNPTGYDITPEQWDQVIEVVKARNLTPFLDMAYQGFGHGIAEDGAVIAKFVAAGLSFFVSTSFSKSFSLYGERVGALSVLCDSKEEADRVLSQLKIVIRTNYSNPPTHGGAIVAAVLNNPEWRALWEKELGEMRVRIKTMRQKLVDGLKAAGVKQDMGFITQQIGMFSYSGLSKEQMQRLRSEFGVYGTDTGRMCVAALNSKNIDSRMPGDCQGGLKRLKTVGLLDNPSRQNPRKRNRPLIQKRKLSLAQDLLYDWRGLGNSSEFANTLKENAHDQENQGTLGGRGARGTLDHSICVPMEPNHRSESRCLHRPHFQLDARPQRRRGRLQPRHRPDHRLHLVADDQG